jgi:hypothetical protein
MYKRSLRAILMSFLIVFLVSGFAFLGISSTGNFLNYGINGASSSLSFSDQSASMSTKVFIQPLATFSFPFPLATRTPTPTPTPEPTPTPIPTPKPILQTPFLDVICKGDAVADGYKVQILGKLLQNDSSAFAEMPILASCSTDEGSSWEDVNLVKTGSDGSFVAIWTPDVAGLYLVRVLFKETSMSNGINKTVSVALVSDPQENAITINSNSSITPPLFDSTSKTLNFNMTGDAGTTGYMHVFVPRNVASQISDLKIYVDDAPVAFNSESKDDSWQLSFTYVHSQHTVTIMLPEVSTFVPNNPESDWILCALVVVAAIVVIASAVGLVKRKRRLQRYAKYIADAKKSYSSSIR